MALPAFVETPPPDALHIDLDTLRRLCRDDPAVAARMATLRATVTDLLTPSIREVGRPNNGDNVTFMDATPTRGNDPDYIVGRLKRDHPALAAAAQFLCDDAAMQTPEPHPPPHPAALSARQAADTLGVHEKTVRRWIERGALAAAKDESGSFRIDPAEVERHRAGQAADTPRGRADPAADVPPHAAPVAADRAAPVDLRPLADVIERQGEEIRRLTEAAMTWQFRAVHLEEQLKQLTAGDPVAERVDTAPDRRQVPPSGAEAVPMAPDAPRPRPGSWLRRLFGRGPL